MSDEHEAVPPIKVRAQAPRTGREPLAVGAGPAKKDEEERRGAGVAWLKAAKPAALSLARVRSLAGTVRRLLNDIPRQLWGPGSPVAWLRALPALGLKGALIASKGPALYLAVAFAFSYCGAQVLAFAVMRLHPRHTAQVRGRGRQDSAGRAGSPQGPLPADGLFGMMPGLFTTNKGSRIDGSRPPIGSSLQAGALPAEGGATGAVESGSAPEGSALPSGSLAGGGMGTKVGYSGDTGSGFLTAFINGTLKPVLGLGPRTERVLPADRSIRKRLMGSAILSGEAAKMPSGESASMHAQAAFEGTALRSRAVSDPVALSREIANGPRPRPSEANGGAPIGSQDGNPDIMRPDLGDLTDVNGSPDDRFTPGTVPNVSRGDDVTLYAGLVEIAKARARAAQQDETSSIWHYHKAGTYAALAAQSPWFIAAGLYAAAAHEASTGLKENLRACEEADEASEMAEQIERRFGQTPEAESIDYCVARARMGKECVFQGDELRSLHCGYKPHMTSLELDAYGRCMGGLK